MKRDKLRGKPRLGKGDLKEYGFEGEKKGEKNGEREGGERGVERERMNGWMGDFNSNVQKGKKGGRGEGEGGRGRGGQIQKLRNQTG